MGLSVDQQERFLDYCHSKQNIFSNRVVKGFFQEEENVLLLLEAVDGNMDSRNELEEKFRKYYFRIRFVKFLVQTINFYTIDQMRMYRKHDYRYQLIFDRSASDEGNSTLGELLLFNHTSTHPEPTTSDPGYFQSTFTNENLVDAFSDLSHKQKIITTLGYSLCYKDHEIAKVMGVSPQAVCKTRNLALKRLRVALQEGR
ncbi:hypothetical protein BK138_34050 [Paenibacillus rhizosphaerae]|uniref:RNA polymerase sigma factor 70 region 4 type 2 domain-containing protein n=1 Tax=Paenibacillus rhizosphaerae TaxID=297318 RepID=A0A1R1DZJ9_9BACL|nr:sigma-70 family RNA polymerase sigma factor [Paenibacillus rhizosphaerae]OMF44997.1 hypothetical protein BK138_34050 [Paenibacillus rhizosphaerae]